MGEGGVCFLVPGSEHLVGSYLSLLLLNSFLGFSFMWEGTVAHHDYPHQEYVALSLTKLLLRRSYYMIRWVAQKISKSLKISSCQIWNLQRPPVLQSKLVAPSHETFIRIVVLQMTNQLVMFLLVDGEAQLSLTHITG